MSLNLGMGAKGAKKSDRDDLARFLADKMEGDAHWIFCLQEVQGGAQEFRDKVTGFLDDKEPQHKLHVRHTKTPGSSVGSAVAILSNRKPGKDISWNNCNDAFVACKFSTNAGHLWVINTHLSSGSKGREIRIQGVTGILRKIASFSARVPVVVAGDFNVTDKALPEAHGCEIKFHEAEYDQTVGALLSSGFERPGMPVSPPDDWYYSTKPPGANGETTDRDLIDYILCNRRVATLSSSPNLSELTVEVVPFKTVETKDSGKDERLSPTDHRAISCQLTWS